MGGAAQSRESARRRGDQKFCYKRGRCVCFEGMTEECCLTEKGNKCDFTEETGQTSMSMPATRWRTSSPATETTQASGTSKGKGRAKPEKPGTDTDQVPSTVIRVVDDQDTLGEIDDPEAVAAFARSFGLS